MAIKETPRPKPSLLLLDKIRGSYNIDFKADPKDLGGGYSLNLHLITEDNSYVARIYKSSISSGRLAAIQAVRDYLLEKGVPFAKLLLSKNGDRYIKFEDNLIEVENYIESDSKMNTWALIEQGMPMLARIHTLLKDIQLDAIEKDHEIVNYVGLDDAVLWHQCCIEKVLASSPTESELYFVKLAEDLMSAVLALETPYKHELPQQLVHGDYWDNNVYFKNNKVVLVTDLGFMGTRPRIEDISLIFYYLNCTYMSEIGHSAHVRKLKNLLEAYNAALKAPLSKDERNMIPIAIVRTSFFMMRNISLMDDEKEYKKWIKEIIPEMQGSLVVVKNIEYWQTIFNQ